MPRTLEDLIKDVIAIEDPKPRYIIATDPVTPWSCAVNRGGNNEIQRARDLPPEIIEEMHLPVTVEGIFKHLKQFQAANKHKPFLKMKNGSVLYVESDETVNLIRVYLGNASTLKVRGNDRAAAFNVAEVYEYQQTFGEADTLTVRLRNRKPEDLLSSPDRARGKAVVPMICFSMFTEQEGGVSSFTIKAEYVRPQETSDNIERRQA